VPFIETCNQRCHHPGDSRPVQTPGTSIGSWKRCAPCPKEKQAHDEIADDMTGFAENGVPELKAVCAHMEEKMKNRIENTAGIAGPADLAGFSDNNSKPESGSDPDFYNFIL
jgi:hypothetical protein